MTFITGSQFCDAVEQSGATCFVPLGWEDFNDESAAQIASQRESMDIVKKANTNVIEFFIRTIPNQFEAIRSVIQSSVAENSRRPIILLPESSFAGGVPFKLGAPGPHPTGIVSVGIFPILSVSVDTAPPAHGILPDSSEKGRQKNEALNQEFIRAWSPAQNELNTVLEQLGAKRTEMYRHNAVMSLSDIFLQLCPASLEYPRSDAPLSLRFTGGLPRSSPTIGTSSELPIWWEDVVSNEHKRQIVAVSQGTMAINYHDLIISTLDALKTFDNLLVIVALGKKGATLPSSTVLPANARVADWIPFDDLLPLSDVFVTNGGYGSFQNALARGIPLVVAAPLFADKTDIADRVEWSGTGINVKTGTPTPEMVQKAVNGVLCDGKYKKRALEVQAEISCYDPMAIITKALDEVALSRFSTESKIQVW